MAKRIRFDWKTFRFMETVQERSDMKVDHASIDPLTGNIEMAYICRIKDVETPLPWNRVISLLMKKQHS